MQSDRRPRRFIDFRQGLLAGVALAAWAPLAASAIAQTQAQAQTQAPQTPPPAADGLTEGAVYVDAAGVTRQGDVVTAVGAPDQRVYLRTRGHVLRGESLSYDLLAGTATADGRVEAVAPGGTVVYASHLELDKDLEAGVAVDFATRLSNGASLMAATAVRRTETVSELNYALFTPCPICDEKGPRRPTISIQAEKVVQDEQLRAVLYRNAVFYVGPVPVFYTPYFAHPDPSVERASGLLVPIINYDQGRGVSVEVPYLHVVSRSEDWLISPQINTRIAPLLNLQWRRRFADGMIVARGGYTHERNFGDFDLNGDGQFESNVRFGDREHRSYLLSHGAFDPDGPWRYGFTAERTSDKTLFDRYDVRTPYQDNGLYYGDRRRLISQIYAEHQTDRSYVSVAAFSIQSLRVDPRFAATDFRDPNGYKVFESDGDLPLVAPLVEARWEPHALVFGGRLRLKGSAVALYRENFVGAPILNPDLVPAVTTGLGGVDSRRITGQMEWRRTVILPVGLRVEPFLDTRVDLYSLSDLPPMMGFGGNETVSRSRLSAGVDVSYPLIKRTAGADIVLEPLAQMSVSSSADLDPRIPNEDAQIIELDESSLFRMDRFSGYDLIEGGARLTAGGRATIRWSEGRSASLFVGRSHRFNREDAFRTSIPDDPARLYDPSGLASETSDWVVQGSFSPSDRIRSWAHATIDGSGDVRRAEAALDGRWGRRNLASVSYILDRANPQPGPLNRNYEFVQLTGQQFVYGNWGFTVAGIADLKENEITRSEVGLLFDDDCLRFELGFRRDNTRVRPSGPSEGVYVRLNLATFGGSGYGQGEMR
ncbi:LPS-assembly protein LptD [Brevundimonas sp. SORGH_AS_0993]|uniref:LPS-assembly protein LptD n=1 Tax=Brevundimonas sp. SORGH_AS_0993 TaxID=3041794 RepID=UPI0027838A6B|nr:LPS assembly protein LptD [Brevundimonas sp. SORGH_AS_0993]MDQ1153828.1 LPS-assembly protein [Brevundimonas sp. SORGH_AS_0993]